MKKQQLRTADDQFHQTTIPQQKVVQLDELNIHAEE